MSESEKLKIRPKALYYEFDDFKRLIDLLDDTSKKHKKNSYQNIEFSAELVDSYKYTSSDKEGYISFLKNENPRAIKEINISFYSEKTRLNFDYSRHRLYENITCDFSAGDKELFSYIKDRLSKLLITNNHNWLIHNTGFQILISILIFTGLVSYFSILFRPKLEFSVIYLGSLIVYFLLFPILSFFIPNIYPIFVLKISNKKSGRLIKDDFWKIIGIILLIILGILIERLL